MSQSLSDLQQQFGQIDIYLFDQLLKGRIKPGMRILDCGCGYGRNVHYFLQSGYEVFGADADARCIAAVRASAQHVNPHVSSENFRVEPVEAMTFPAEFADVVASSAVLHFAANEAHFRAMLVGSWRVLKRGGLFFCRLASSIGMEHEMQALDGRRCRLPDGSERFLVDEPLLMGLSRELGGEPLDPIKTTVVQHQRCMTTWVLRKSG